MNEGAIILSGGRGERFGFKEKGLIAFKGESLISRKVRQLSDRFDQIVVVTNRADLYAELSSNVDLVKDDKEYEGPLRGLCCGLRAAEADMNFLCAVDMPFIDYDLLELFRKSCAGFDAVVGRLRGRIEPMFGFYSRRLLSTIESVIPQRGIGLTDLVGMCETRYIAEDEIKKLDPELSSFTNINTEEDLRDAIDD